MMSAKTWIQPLQWLRAAPSAAGDGRTQGSVAGDRAADIEIEVQSGPRAYRLALALRRWDVAAAGLEAAHRHGLSAAERQRLEALTNPKRRVEFLYGRVAAKAAIGRLHPQFGAADWSVTPGLFRQPLVHGPEPVEVSIAHTRDCATALAFSAELLAGVDMERLRPDSQHVIKSQMTACEMQTLAASSLPEPMQLTLAWSAKEALSKALRLGLLLPFRELGLKRVDYRAEWDVWLITFQLAPPLVVYAWLQGDEALTLALPQRLELKRLAPMVD